MLSLLVYLRDFCCCCFVDFCFLPWRNFLPPLFLTSAWYSHASRIFNAARCRRRFCAFFAFFLHFLSFFLLFLWRRFFSRSLFWLAFAIDFRVLIFFVCIDFFFIFCVRRFSAKPTPYPPFKQKNHRSTASKARPSAVLVWFFCLNGG